MPPKKRKREDNSKWSAPKPKSKIEKTFSLSGCEGNTSATTRCSSCQNEVEAFLLYIYENMITTIVKRTNDQMRKVHKKIKANKFLFRYSDTNE